MSTLLYFGMTEKNSSCGSFLPHFICFRHHITGGGEGGEFGWSWSSTHYKYGTKRGEFIYLHQVEHAVFKAFKWSLRLLSANTSVKTGFLWVVTLRIFKPLAWFAFWERKGSAHMRQCWGGFGGCSVGLKVYSFSRIRIATFHFRIGFC